MLNLLRINLLMAALAIMSAARAQVRYAGVNLYGLANDVSILGSAYSLFESGNCNASYAAYPFFNTDADYYEWRALGFNLFRLPVGWQHIQTNLSGPLNQTTLTGLDQLIETITGNDSMAIVDIHNYARWYCTIIGQPQNSFPEATANVTDDDFINLWTQLALHYRNNPRVMFQLMNEPHDLNVTLWAATNAKVIAAIRQVAPQNYILIDGTQFARLTDWHTYSQAALAPLFQGSNSGDQFLLYDFHQYFDDDGGAYGVCEPWSTFSEVFTNVTKFLRSTGAKGIITEFGGAPCKECTALYDNFLPFLGNNSDVWFGWTSWGSPGDLEISTNSSSPFYTLTSVLAKYAPLAV